jgi:hypothetical protein
MEIKVSMETDKVTKNTIRYRVIDDGKPPAITTLYIAKWKLGKNPPSEIELTVKASTP